MSGECDRCGHHCMDCVCNAPDCTNRALEILSQIDADLWRGYTTQEKKAAEDEIARLTSEVTQLRADLANAGAVMVEAALRLPAYDSDGDPAGQFDQQVFVRRDDLRALSTLSPIAAAAGMVADAIDADMRTFNQCLDEEPATGETKAGHFFAQVIRRYARALAEQEKAE